MKIRNGIVTQVLLATIIAANAFAIVNGQVETNFAAVGVLDDGAGHRASGILIDPFWVLTAASFAADATGGSFLIGLDSSSPDEIHAISELFPHFDYDPWSGDNNLGLVRLTTPVDSVTPLPFLTNPSSLFAGAPVQYVGYGWATTQDPNNTLRRSCISTVALMQFTSFVTYDEIAGPYVGDAGGPALLEVGGVTYVAGIVSAFPEGPLSYTISTRVTTYVTFIESVMTENPPLSGVAATPSPRPTLQAAPNPFNPATDLSFSLEDAAHCRLRVLDLKGRVVIELANRTFGPGDQTVVWRGRTGDGGAAPSGVYVVELRTDREMDSRKIVLAR